LNLRVQDGAVHAAPEIPALYGDADFAITGDLATATLRLVEGEHHDLVLAANRVDGESPCARAGEFFAATQAFWEEWIGYCRYRGVHEEAVKGSALALKLMTFAPSGAIVAASLPNVRPMYGIDGTLNLDEVKLDHLAGYRASTPVRCGNGA